MTDALADKLGDIVTLGVSVRGISKNGNSYQVHTADRTIEADIVIAATPAYASAGMLRDLDTGLSEKLSNIPYPHVSVVCFGYEREKVKHPLNGFGFLIPFIEGRKILGNLWDSSIFPNRASEGHVLLRTMAGGAKFPQIGELDDDRLLSLVFDELKPILQLTAEPDMVRIYRWEKAIPQYLLGHEGIVNSLDDMLKKYPGLYLTGNAYRGIGINDCIENGYKIAEEILQTLTA